MAGWCDPRVGSTGFPGQEILAVVAPERLAPQKGWPEQKILAEASEIGRRPCWTTGGRTSSGDGADRAGRGTRRMGKG